MFIVDNVALAGLKNEQDVFNVIARYPGCRWVLLGNTNSFVGDSSRQVLASVVKQIYIRMLPRRAIREMSRRWCQITGNNDLEANDFIIRQVTDNHLPRTGYIVSLLMWAYQKEKKLERINEAYLLSAVIDSLLGKADFTKALRKEFDPTLAELTLQHLALFLRANGHSIDSNEVLIFLVEFFKKKRLEFNAGDVLGKLVQCGVLADQGGSISFKYRCFQEFFIASHLTKSPHMITKIIQEDILAYKRELYLLSGLRRQNEDLIGDLMKRLLRIKPKKLEDVSKADFAKIVEKRVYDDTSHKKLTAHKTKKITSDQVDDLLDTAEKEIEREELDDQSDKQQPAPDGSADGRTEARDVPDDPGEERGSISAYMNEVGLLGLIIKNSEFDDGDVKSGAIRFYLDESLVFCVSMVRVLNDIVDIWFSEEGRQDPDEKKLFDDEIKAVKAKMIFIMEKIMVTIMTLKVSSDLGSEKMALVFRELFEAEETSVDDRLFLSLIMYDLNQSDWEGSLKEVVEENGKRPFTLDVVTERLWHDLYTRYEPEDRRVQISRVVDAISSKLGGESGYRKRSSRQAVDKAAFLTQARDG